MESSNNSNGRRLLFSSPLLYIFAFCFLLFPIANAQSIPAFVNGLSLSASTESPYPGQSVTITAQSYSIDINSATITWYVSGSRISQGVGKTTLTVQAPALGKTMTIEADVTTPDGQQLSDTTSIKSGSVDLIVEPDGYVPPFFMGKLPAVYQNNVKVVAMPHLADASGNEYDPKTLVYEWNKDNSTVLSDQSGYDKQSITLPSPLIPRPFSLTVKVSTRSGSASAEGTISITPEGPFITFYADDPLYGPMYNKAVASIMRIGAQKETGAIAVPYGFNKPLNGLGNLALSWFINGTEHPELENGDSVVLRAPDASSGSSDIELRASNRQNILQSADSGFSVTFSAGSATSTTSSITY